MAFVVLCVQTNIDVHDLDLSYNDFGEIGAKLLGRAIGTNITAPYTCDTTLDTYIYACHRYKSPHLTPVVLHRHVCTHHSRFYYEL